MEAIDYAILALYRALPADQKAFILAAVKGFASTNKTNRAEEEDTHDPENSK